MLKRLSLSLVILLALASAAAAQELSEVNASVALFQRMRVVPNVVYTRANGWEGKLDIYVQRMARQAGPVPVVVFIHGGGWVQGTKEGSVVQGLLPDVPPRFTGGHVR